MRRETILVTIALTLLAGGIFLGSEQFRYTLVVRADDLNGVYKLDKRTGRVWLLYETIAIEVRDRDYAKPQSPEEKAIELAKKFVPSGQTSSADEMILKALPLVKGPLRVDGWKAKRIDDQTYLAAYVILLGSESRSWAYEINMKAEIVRDVHGDAELEKKYADLAKATASLHLQ